MSTAFDAQTSSRLLAKAASLGLRVPEDLEKLALARGLRYYAQPGELEELRQEPRLQVSRDAFSDAELAVALLGPGLVGASGVVALYRQRLGGATASAEGVDPAELVRLAMEEGCAALVRYVAECGRDVEPGNGFWEELLRLLPWEEPPEDRPHITRLIAMTGITRKGPGIIRQWIRPWFWIR
jgi:hypothetical protein